MDEYDDEELYALMDDDDDEMYRLMNEEGDFYTGNDEDPEDERQSSNSGCTGVFLVLVALVLIALI